MKAIVKITETHEVHMPDHINDHFRVSWPRHGYRFEVLMVLEGETTAKGCALRVPKVWATPGTVCIFETMAVTTKGGHTFEMKDLKPAPDLRLTADAVNFISWMERILRTEGARAEDKIAKVLAALEALRG